ncbi:contact-dependent growth inhibition system immunity protein [Paludifilum halophilum]|uniref:CdiI immunity protein domain-containing protein n=1 Tax=Paludifilum halophilum TaxID=1642702 RepID=A0A235B1F5_9BACL|nr:contact-dependent growth inhibition system immunity protein [Paludifilum halophilum]OYD06130.1 hypothetical protein CHM34_17910 [Paludifilum halophilum]
MFQFLAGVFHQDFESPEEALEMIRECGHIELDDTSKFIRCFLELGISDEDKNKFTEEHSWIYFPALGMTPLEWLKEIVVDLEKSVKIKKAEEKSC